MRRWVGYLGLLFITGVLVLNPEKAVYYAHQGTELCFEVIIPSLFPFFVCSGLLIYSGFCEVLAAIFRPVMKPLFNINSNGAAAFILGIISGYPLGAVTVCQLYSAMYLSKSEAERLLAFCNNSGPLFILGAVGASIYHSPKIGIILYAAHILSAITVGIIFRFYKRESYNAPPTSLSTANKNPPEIFSEVLNNSIQSILTVCGAVIFCSVMSKLLLDMFNFSPNVQAALMGIMEFVSGLKRVSLLEIELAKKLLMSAWICAFAGVSVHLQVMGVTAKTGLSLKPYIAGKLLHGFFAVVYTYAALKIVPTAQTAFSCGMMSQRLAAGCFAGALYSAVGAAAMICVAVAVRLLLSRKKIKIAKLKEKREGC